MLRFFRQIRTRLLLSNNFSKYALYALGEILLVMVGILLALQVNNWNENRNKELELIDILSEIRNNIKEDIRTAHIQSDRRDSL